MDTEIGIRVAVRMMKIFFFCKVELVDINLRTNFHKRDFFPTIDFTCASFRVKVLSPLTKVKKLSFQNMVMWGIKLSVRC